MEQCGRRRGGVRMGVHWWTEDGWRGRVRRVWMVLDGSKEASLPSCRVKPSLALQQRVTHSISQWRILGQIGFRTISPFVNLRGVSSPHQAVWVNKSNAPSPYFWHFTFRLTSSPAGYLSRDLPIGCAVHF